MNDLVDYLLWKAIEENIRLQAFTLRLADHLYLAAEVLAHLAERRKEKWKRVEEGVM